MLQCIYFFVIGAFVGWMLECSFKYFSRDFYRSPGILNTPFCILYGLGTVVLSMVINRITNNIWLLFIYSMVALTVMEYVTFVLLKKVYNVKLWDYSNMKFKLNEKVCLEFAISWGVLGTLYIKYLLTFLLEVYNNINIQLLTISLITLVGIIIIDFFVSTFTLIKRKHEVKI